jgi:hypothetical protein
VTLNGDYDGGSVDIVTMYVIKALFSLRELVGCLYSFSRDYVYHMKPIHIL